jgi:proteasome lid subunit RPN8/RPN11
MLLRALRGWATLARDLNVSAFCFSTYLRKTRNIALTVVLCLFALSVAYASTVQKAFQSLDAKDILDRYKGGVFFSRPSVPEVDCSARSLVNPVELIRVQRGARERGLEIVGFNHSHPDHPAHWSATDLAEAHWIGCSYVITSVLGGNAETTHSFHLTGSTEEDKCFHDEEVVVH